MSIVQPPRLLSEMTADADAIAIPDDRPAPEQHKPTAILPAAENVALTYPRATVAALSCDRKNAPINQKWARRAGAFLPQALDAVYSGVQAAANITGHGDLSHPEIRIRTMKTLDILSRNIAADNLEWPLYVDRVLSGYRNLPLY